MADRSQMYSLLDRYMSGISSCAETEQLLELIVQERDNGVWEELVSEIINNQWFSELVGDAECHPFVQELIVKSKAEHKLAEDYKTRSGGSLKRIVSWKSVIWAAASILVVLAAGVYLWFDSTQHVRYRVSSASKVNISAGSRQGAVLTLSDGSLVRLDSIKNGVVALHGGGVARVVNGALVYDSKGDEIYYNAMTTPKGRQYQVTLPDGSVVWLNSASSIRFPTVFKGIERRVAVMGEAYFDVVQNEKMPFVVDVNGKASISVLGTGFNVNAYANEEAINATLITGAIKISSGAKNKDVLLKPGEQAQIKSLGLGNGASHAITVRNVDTEKIIAWKNGVFMFEGVGFAEIMRQIERWYDIEVVYENGVPDLALMGEITRGISLDGLLDGLSSLGVHYRLEGSRLYILE